MDRKDTATLGKVLQVGGQNLKVRELANLLGVHPDTIRRWEKQGYLKCQRHPINNYRLFCTDELRGIYGNGKIK